MMLHLELIKNNDALVAIIFVSLLFPAVCAITFVRDGQTESYGPVVRVLRIPRNRGSSTHPFTKLWQAPWPPFELGIRDGGEGQGLRLPK